MKKAKVLIVTLIVLLALQLGYIIFAHIQNRDAITSVLKNRPADDIKINFTDNPPLPPTEDRIIANFENPEDTSGIITADAHYSLSDKFPISGYYSLRFDFEAVGYPALAFHYLPRHWSYYNKLSISIYNPATDSMTCLIRINDHQSTGYPDTYYAEKISITPGINTLMFQVSRIGEKIDINDILNIIISIEKPSHPGTVYTVYIDDIILHY